MGRLFFFPFLRATLKLLRRQSLWNLKACVTVCFMCWNVCNFSEACLMKTDKLCEFYMCPMWGERRTVGGGIFMHVRRPFASQMGIWPITSPVFSLSWYFSSSFCLCFPLMISHSTSPAEKLWWAQVNSIEQPSQPKSPCRLLANV